MNVPAEAQIWIDGVATKSTGETRNFDSPPLTPGRRYTYHVVARWKQDGQEMTQTQPVVVTAGKHTDVDFPVTDKETRKPSEGSPQPAQLRKPEAARDSRPPPVHKCNRTAT